MIDEIRSNKNQVTSVNLLNKSYGHKVYDFHCNCAVSVYLLQETVIEVFKKIIGNL